MKFVYRVGYLLCGPERWMVDHGPIYTEQLFGAAMTKTDRSLFLVVLFLKATPSVVLLGLTLSIFLMRKQRKSVPHSKTDF